MANAAPSPCVPAGPTTQAAPVLSTRPFLERGTYSGEHFISLCPLRRLTLRSTQSLCHLRRRDANRPWRKRHRTGGGLRDRHLLRRWVQQSFLQANLPVCSRQLLLREPQAVVHRDSVQQFSDHARLSRRSGKRRKLCCSRRRQSQLNLRHLRIFTYIRFHHHSHQ